MTIAKLSPCMCKTNLKRISIGIAAVLLHNPCISTEHPPYSQKAYISLDYLKTASFIKIAIIRPSLFAPHLHNICLASLSMIMVLLVLLFIVSNDLTSSTFLQQNSHHLGIMFIAHSLSIICT
jgi:hypothetical protein